MLDRTSAVLEPQIQDLIAVLQQERVTGNDLRSESRELVVCPVTVQLQYELTRSRAFTKDISAQGVCLITEVDCKVEQIATLAIYRANDLPRKVRARCVWEKEMGNGFYLSGWKFLRRVLQNNG